jgi:hypothetical protein
VIRHHVPVIYEELYRRLLPEAVDLFRQMVSAHLASSSDDRLFIESQGLGGPTRLIAPSPTEQITGFDRGALDDLSRYGLIQRGMGSRGGRNYRITGEGVHFHRWMMAREGEPISQVESHARRLLDSPTFAEHHPGAGHHLSEAFQLLWTGRTDTQAVSEIGDHLRKALFDVTDDLAGLDSGKTEQPVDRLKAYVEQAAHLAGRERTALASLVTFVQDVLRLDHRLAHVRDELDKDVPLRDWDELRRAAFLTVVVCFELHALGQH